MARIVTVVGILMLMAAWHLPVGLAASASALVIAGTAKAALPAQVATERFRITAKPAKSHAELATRLTSAKRQLEQQEAEIERALAIARKAELDATARYSDPAASSAVREKSALQLRRATELIAQLMAMREQVAQNKAHVTQLLARTSTGNMRNARTPNVPKDLADTLSQVEDLEQKTSLESQRAAAVAFRLQTADVPTIAEPPVGDRKRAKQQAPGQAAPEPSRSPASKEPGAAPPPPPPPASIVGSSGGSPSHSQPAPMTLAARVADWFAQLQQGALQYKVPRTMYWKMSSTVTVVIQGPKAQPESALAGATGSGQVKVSDRMRVVVSCPDNPDEFIISRQEGTDEIQFVPENSSATWNWSVTPKYTGRSQKLSIAAWVLYPGQDDKVLQQLPVYTANIDVHVPGIGESLKRLIEGDPDYWLRYGLPGGGGFIFLASALAGLRKWSTNRKGKRKRTLSTARR